MGLSDEKEEQHRDPDNMQPKATSVEAKDHKEDAAAAEFDFKFDFQPPTGSGAAAVDVEMSEASKKTKQTKKRGAKTNTNRAHSLLRRHYGGGLRAMQRDRSDVFDMQLPLLINTATSKAKTLVELLEAGQRVVMSCAHPLGVNIDAAVLSNQVAMAAQVQAFLRKQVEKACV